MNQNQLWALEYLTQYINGIITRFELVNLLAGLDLGTLLRLPDMPDCHPARQGLKEEVFALRDRIAAGDTIPIASSCEAPKEDPE